MGKVFKACYSQNKDELILEFGNAQSFFIKASLLPSLSCLSFPESFNRAKKNSVDLFKDLIGQKVVKVLQYGNERSFSIEFHNESLLFKMHGARSNIIHIKNEKPVALFRNHLNGDLLLDPVLLDRQIDWSQNNFIKNLPSIRKIYFTFGKRIWNYLEQQNFKKLSPDLKWELVSSFRKEIVKSKFYVSELDGELALIMFKDGNILQEFSDPIKACNEFFKRWHSANAFLKAKKSLEKSMQEKLTKANIFVETNLEKIDKFSLDHHFQQWADLIMANLHLTKPYQEKISVVDFYHNNESVEIPLKKELSLQKNAEVYYRKSKSQQREIDKLKSSTAKKQKTIDELEKGLMELNSITEIKDLHKKFGTTEIEQKPKSDKGLPFHSFTTDGFQIYVGKNAKSNDDLTLRHAKKDDLWLHAKDVAGSHVVIKHKSGTNFPKSVIERAAELAAYYSKRKNESLCPVAYTPKKFVRKRKGDLDGVVVVEREKVILVKPRNF